MSFIEFNINDYVQIKLTPLGKEELKKQHKELNDFIGGNLGEYRPKEETTEGWSSWQLHSLMNTFGHMMTLGSMLPCKTIIRFKKE